MPALYTEDDDEAETLIIQLKDAISGLTLQLFYTIYQNHSVIIRSTQLVNNSDETVEINRLASQSIDFPNRPLELIHLNGTWARERQMTREKNSYRDKSIR